MTDLPEIQDRTPDPADQLVRDILGELAGEDVEVTAGEYNGDGSRRRIGPGGDGAHRRTIALRRHRRLLREGAALDTIGPFPAPGEEILLVLNGRFHGVDILSALIRLAAPAVCRAAHLATLSINRTHTRLLADYLDDGRIQALTLVISKLFRNENPADFEYLRATLAARGATLACVQNHTKLFALEFTDGRKLAIHGSLNLRRCNAYEQAAICHDPETHDFLREFILQVAAAHAGDAPR